MSRKKEAVKAEAAAHPHTAKTIDVDMETVLVNIADLDHNDNRELDEEAIQRLMTSIGQYGLFTAIRVTRDNNIVYGSHRVEACKRLGWSSIPAVYHDGAIMPARIQENTVRKDLTFNQRIEAAKWVEENYVRPRGRPRKNGDLVDETGSEDGNIGQNSVHFSGRARDVVVEMGIYTSPEVYRQAKYIKENCVPRVFELIDAGHFSYDFAYTEIAQKIPLNQQKSALHKIEGLVGASVNTKGAKKAVRNSLKDTRRAKAGIPKNPQAPTDEESKYEVARVVPNWMCETMEDLRDLPVSDFLREDGVVCVVAPNHHVGDAIELLQTWGFQYRIMGMAHDGKDNGKSPYPIFYNITVHNVIGTRTKNQSLKKYHRVLPVFTRENALETALIQNTVIFETPDNKGRLLDMSTSEDSEEWVSWKKKFGNN